MSSSATRASTRALALELESLRNLGQQPPYSRVVLSHEWIRWLHSVGFHHVIVADAAHQTIDGYTRNRIPTGARRKTWARQLAEAGFISHWDALQRCTTEVFDREGSCSGAC